MRRRKRNVAVVGDDTDGHPAGKDGEDDEHGSKEAFHRVTLREHERAKRFTLSRSSSYARKRRPKRIQVGCDLSELFGELFRFRLRARQLILNSLEFVEVVI